MSQVIKKRNIVLASVLKPVDDTRMFEKMGQSFADSNAYEVHIIGYPSRKEHNYPNIHFHPSKAFKRLSFYRLLIPVKTFVLLLRLKPDRILINTHELLFITCLLKWIRGTKIIYDVRENYYRNILFLSTFSILVRPLLALYVRLKEKLCAPFVSLFILSDEGYTKELTFIKKKFIVVENKAKEIISEKRLPGHHQSTIQLLFSGTIARSTGIFTAIELAKSLHAIDERIRLLIIGYCAQHTTLKQIHTLIDKFDFIQLAGGDKLVPHDEIAEAINQADFGIIAYPPNPATKNTLPTKIFEYIAARLPFLLINHPAWVNRCQSYPAAVVFDPLQYKPDELLNKMNSSGFYIISPGSEVYWETEAKKLVEAMGKL